MSDKIYSGLRIIFLVMAIIISLYYFKLPFALLSSILFIVYIYTQKVLKELDNKGLISLLGVVHPVFLQYVKTNILLSYNYPIIIKFANSTLSLLKIHYVVTKEEIDTVLVYLFLLGVVEIVSRIDTTATGRIAERKTVFRAKEFVEENDDFCKKYSKKIEKLYADINWSEFNCVPIEAETTIERGHRIKHYNNLLKCLRKNRGMTSPKLIVLVKRLKYSWIGNRYGIKQLVRWLEDKLTHNNIYLISGDPGSGKSMALLKLCIDLLKESYITGKTPVYINLKQWRSETGEWSKNNRPTEKELISFIKSQLYEDGDLATDSFLDQYFEMMLKHGRFYFIFDSFDEMPCFIDSNDNGFLRDCISGLSGLERLKYLDLSGTKVSNIGALTNLKALESLYLATTKVSDINALSELSNISTLDLRRLTISSIPEKIIDLNLSFITDRCPNRPGIYIYRNSES